MMNRFYVKQRRRVLLLGVFMSEMILLLLGNGFRSGNTTLGMFISQRNNDPPLLHARSVNHF